MRVLTIALNTFREGIRAKVMYSLLFFAILIVSVSYFLGQLTIGENIKIMKDLGIASISIFGMLTAVFVGIGLIYKELEKRTVYTIISKPIHRYEFVLGKYFGLCLTLLVQVVVMWLFFSGLLFFYTEQPPLELLRAGVGIYLELMVITALAIFFSSFSSPFLSALFTLGVLLIGHSTSQLYDIVQKTKNVLLMPIAELLHFFNLELFDLKTEVVYGITITSARMLNMVRYGVCWIVLILFASCIIFQKRDFK